MIKHKYKRKYNCRLCKSKKLKIFYKYQNSPLCDEYLKKPKKQYFYPMTLQICQDCKFIQLNTVIEPSSIYDNYLYFTKSSISLKNHFEKYAKEISSVLKIKKKMRVMDIGSNDGMLLSFFKKQGHEVFGVEPYKDASLSANKNKIKTFNRYFDKKFVDDFLSDNRKVDIISVNNLFANIDNVNSFTNYCNQLLNKDGFMIIESSYLFDMLDNNIFDFVYHEHLSYFSIIPLLNFMKQFGFELFDLKKSDSKGGSMRYIFKKGLVKENKIKLNKLVNLEKNFYKNLSIKLKKYSDNIKSLKSNFNSLLNENNYSKIAAFGASATSTTFLSEIEISKKIDFLVDENPQKIGRFSPGYHKEVKDIKSLERESVDLIIILAWRYEKSISKKLKNIKVPCLIPLPKFKLVNN